MSHGKLVAFIIAAIVLSTLLRFGVTGPTDIVLITLHPTADAYVNSESSDTSHGRDGYLFVSSNSEFNYTYVMFDLSSIPSNADIKSANLSLYLDQTGGVLYIYPPIYQEYPPHEMPPYDIIGVYRCPDTSWTELGITWNNRPSFDPTPTDTWSFPIEEGADYCLPCHIPSYDAGFYAIWNITEDVARAFKSDKKLTEVLVFEQKEEYGYAGFVSKEGNYKPKLDIKYSGPPLPSPLQLQHPLQHRLLCRRQY